MNYQCLHTQPEYNLFGSGGSVISGVEYQSGSSGIFPVLLMIRMYHVLDVTHRDQL